MADQPYLKLNNGVSMPQIGLGVWQASDDEAEQAVSWALDAGYRLIDTAAAYGNEAGVGKAVRKSSIDRSEIFVTTKLWNADQGYDSTLQAFEKSMDRLKLDYVDLYLIHWPMPAHPRYLETWKAFTKLYNEKRIRAIGVSNFMPDHLQDLITKSDVVPVVNQIELHPYLQQHELRDYCQEHDIKIESWSPIGGHRGNVLEDPVVVEIAQKHGKSPAQIIISWHLQNGLVVIPKSVHKERIEENFDVFDFELDEQDMAALGALDRGTRFGADPATANFT